MIKRILLVVSLILFSFTVLIAQNNEEDEKEDKSRYKSSTFSGLKFRSLGPAITSGRVTDFAVNPENCHEFYVQLLPVMFGRLQIQEQPGIPFLIITVHTQLVA